jgi:hypothetical protein
MPQLKSEKLSFGGTAWSFTKYLCGYYTDGMWWIRLFGYGITWKDGRTHYLNFSERMGKKGFRMRHWVFNFLKREKRVPSCEINAKNKISLAEMYMAGFDPYTVDEAARRSLPTSGVYILARTIMPKDPKKL